MSRYLPDTPGPKYDLSTTSFVEVNAKKKKGFSMSGKLRTLPSADAIGPQRYNIVRDFDRDARGGSKFKGAGASFAFTGKPRDISEDREKPGPGAYYKQRLPSQFDTSNKKKGFSLSGRTRVPSGDDEGPSPARYNVIDSYNKSQLSHKDGTGPSAIMSHRHPRPADSDSNPGPKYNLPVLIGRKGDKVIGRAPAFGRRVHEPRTDDGPGPAKYNPALPFESEERKKKRGHTFGLLLNPGASTYITSNLATKIMLKEPPQQG